jgi:hypothetical protein
VAVLVFDIDSRRVVSTDWRVLELLVATEDIIAKINAIDGMPVSDFEAMFDEVLKSSPPRDNIQPPTNDIDPLAFGADDDGEDGYDQGLETGTEVGPQPLRRSARIQSQHLALVTTRRPIGDAYTLLKLQAGLDEMSYQLGNGVLVQVDWSQVEPQAQVLGCHMRYVDKFSTTLDFLKVGGRNVALGNGHNIIPGTDTAAPTVQMHSILLAISLAAFLGFDLKGLYFSKAYLNATAEDRFMYGTLDKKNEILVKEHLPHLLPRAKRASSCSASRSPCTA